MPALASPLARALGYRKFGGSSPRLLVMKSSYFVVEDVVDAARHLSWPVHELTVDLATRGDSEFIKRLLLAVVQFKPDFILTINHIGFDKEGGLAGLLADYGIPLATWFVDHPMTILGGSEANARSTTQVFCFERTALTWLEQAGFEDPAYLPTASNSAVFDPERVDPARAKRLGRPLAFVGNSWWEKARSSFTPAIRQEARALVDDRGIDRSFLLGGLEGELAQRDPESQRCYVLAVQAALAESSMQSRQGFVEALQELGLVVFGDEHWSDLVEGLALERPVDFRRDLPALFAGTRVNVNITAEQMPTALNQRVWDVPAVGSFLLTDAQSDLFEFFEEDVDVVAHRSLDEARDKARFYLGNDSARKAIAARARVKVEAEHRTHHRLERLEAVMRRRFG
jgi:spore maturation protein CgeB